MLDPNLITSDVCTQCARCCLFEKWVPEHANELDIPMKMSWNGDGNSVPVQKLEMYGETWLACGYLKDKKCTNYENRPKLCSVWDCFQNYNISGSSPSQQPWIVIETIQEIIDEGLKST